MNGNDKEYAIALFSLMLESDEADKVIPDIDLVDTSFKVNPEYIDYLSNAYLAKSERIESLRRVFGGQVCEYG